MIQQTVQIIYEGLCGALRRPLSEGGHLALTAALHGADTATIAEALQQLTRVEALAVFNWLDNARAVEVLAGLDSQLAQFLLKNAPAGRIAAMPIKQSVR